DASRSLVYGSAGDARYLLAGRGIESSCAAVVLANADSNRHNIRWGWGLTGTRNFRLAGGGLGGNRDDTVALRREALANTDRGAVATRDAHENRVTSRNAAP